MVTLDDHRKLDGVTVLIDRLPIRSSSLMPHRGLTLSFASALVILTNDDHRHRRLGDGRMKDMREES